MCVYYKHTHIYIYSALSIHRQTRYTGTSLNDRFLSYLFNDNNFRCTGTRIPAPAPNI